MQPSDIQKIIEAEIAAEREPSNVVRVNVSTCLVTPEKKPFRLDSGETQELWVVLEQDPTTHSGYKVVFDEQRGDFGLAIDLMSEPDDHYLGPFGSFLTTLDAM